MKHGTQSQLGRKIGVKPQTIHGLIMETNTRHASYQVAKKLALETETAPDLWQRAGAGTPESRRAAIQAWAASARPKLAQS